MLLLLRRKEGVTYHQLIRPAYVYCVVGVVEYIVGGIHKPRGPFLDILTPFYPL